MSHSREAAVLICISSNGDGEKVLLTQRSMHLKSHAGEVALPGGMWEQGDADLSATALREANEEVGLQPADIVSPLQPMPSRYTRQGIRVTPYHCVIASGSALRPCQRELQSLFWLPMDIVLSDARLRTDIFDLDGTVYWAPVYAYQGYCLWGFTAKLLVDFANQYRSAAITRNNNAPERFV